MQTPPTVTFRGVRYPEQLETDVRTRLARLERYHPSIVSARVRIDQSGRHREGNRYRVPIELGIPGADVIVAHDASASRARHVNRRATGCRGGRTRDATGRASVRGR